MRIAVVGASGNIGTHLLRELERRDEVERIVAICRRTPDPTGAGAGGRVHWTSLDISRPEATHALATAFDGCDVVVHLAWLIQPSHAAGVMHATNVDGSRHVFHAVRAAGVPALVHASSIGAYAPADKDRRRDERWPATGIDGSLYSVQKAAVERMLDDVERDLPGLRVVRVRPAVVTSGTAAAEQTRYFLGPFVPRSLLRLLPLVPDMPGLLLQLVHSEDVAAAFALAALGPDFRGAVNVADEPVLTPVLLGEVLRARAVRVPPALARAALEATWRLRLHPVDRGWLEMALHVPLMDTTRAQQELGWTPRHDAADTLREAVEGILSGRGGPTPVLRPIRGVADQVAGGLRALSGRTGGRI